MSSLDDINMCTLSISSDPPPRQRPRTVAVNGVNLLDDWHPDLANESSVFFPSYPDAPQGDLYR